LTTINTTEDFLTLMRENQEFREAARQAILTEELLALPAVFSTFASEMRTDFRRLEGDVSEVRSDVRQLQEGQKRLEGDVSEVRSDVRQLQEGQKRLEGDVSEVRSDIGRLEDGQKRLEEGQKRLSDRVDSIRGTSLEQRLSTKLLPLVGREFNVRRVFPIWSPGVIDVSGNTRDFHDRLEQAVEDGIIDDDEEARLRVTDLIMRSQRKTDRSTLWFTVEASGVINDDDITRSQQSANAIEKIYGQDTIPIVYGYGIHEDQKRLADELGVQVYLDPEGD
jgi:outer membrane murein-binding lipoprotein Lpp